MILLFEIWSRNVVVSSGGAWTKERRWLARHPQRGGHIRYTIALLAAKIAHTDATSAVFLPDQKKKALDFTESPMPFYVWHHVQNLTYLLGILLLGQGVCIDGAPEDHKSVIEILQKEIGGHIQGCYQILIPPQSIR